MAKIVLGKRPETFKRTVSVPMLDGTKGTIECTFRYRTRKEFGALVDSIRAEAEKLGAQATTEAAPTEEGAPAKAWSMRDHFEKLVGTNADYMLQILDGWNLDVPLNAESLQQLSDELPAASESIVEAYRVATIEGRLGN